MKLLFLDRQCPGHFPVSVRWLASKPENELVFLSDFRRNNFNEPRIIHKTVRLPSKLPQGTSAKHVLAMTHIRATAYAAAMRKLKENGFTPDYICHGAASCCALYAKDVYPNVPQLGVFDWYHQALGHEEAGYTADVAEGQSFGGLQVHNVFQMAMLEASSVICTPSAWQRDSYPATWRERMHVVHPGIDTDYFTPTPADASKDFLQVDGQALHDPTIAFLERRLSPASGFGAFYRLLPKLFAQDAHCQIIFSGAATQGKDGAMSYMEHILQSYPVDAKRLHHMVFHTAEEYRRVLRASTLYVHMPLEVAPPARGLLEAMSCGCLVVAAETPSLRGLLRHKHNALLVPARNAESMTQILLMALQEVMPHIRKQARKDILEKYDAKANLQTFLHLLEIYDCSP